MAIILAGMFASGAAFGQDQPVPRRSAETPAYPTSPYHGVLDGSGRIIPCLCRFQGQKYRLGETVCMATAVGVVMARCDLMLNNTSWIPTQTPCTLSGIDPLARVVLAR